MVHGRILQLLKDGTAAQHEAVERRVDLANRLRDVSAYADLLGRFYGFYAPLERALGRVAGCGAVDVDFGERQKAPWLAADLTALGRDPDRVPRWETPPSSDSLGQALGRWYVLEGATLGGRLIRKEVKARLGLTPERGCAFFAGYGDRAREMWDAFRAALVAHATAPAVEEEIVSAARDTFDALDRWLARPAEVTP